MALSALLVYCRLIPTLEQKKKIGAVTSQYGKYGIINESEFSFSYFPLTCNPFDHGRDSLYNQGQEFRAWLVEERKINPETQSKESTRKEFAQFVEDYNTGPYFPFTLAFSGERADNSSDIAPRKVLQHGCVRTPNERPATRGVATCG